MGGPSDTSGLLYYLHFSGTFEIFHGESSINSKKY